MRMLKKVITCKGTQNFIVDMSGETWTRDLQKMEELENISHLDLPGYSGDHNSATNMKPGLNTCVGCLAKNVPLVSLANCKHTEFFDCNVKLKLEYASLLVCYVCHGMLKDIYLFKRQVETNLLNLNQQGNLRLNNIRLKNLEQSNTEIFHTYNSEPISKEVIKPTVKFEIKTEVKIEVETEYSDPENEVPLSEIKEKKEKDPNTELIKVKYGGRIKIVTLNETEMWEERKREAAKEQYKKLLYKCEDCIVGYDHELTLKEHMAKRHGEVAGGFTCTICKSVLTSLASFKGHMRRHYRRINCSACSARYTTAMSAMAHYSKMHAASTTKYKCEECEFTTTSYRRLRYHRDKHKQKVRCDQCGNTFVNNSGLKVHMYTVHKVSNRVYSCAECSKTYSQRSGLLSHMESTHGGAGAYCAPCRTHFKTEHNLRNHLHTHSKHAKDKKHACNLCDARFLTKGQLTEHTEWEHLKTTKHTCEECNKAFKSSTKLRRHVNYVHEKKRPPRNKMCDHCGRGFTTLSILRSHIRTHTGERPHTCAHCPATFAHSAALYTHNKLLHSHSLTTG